MTGTTDTIRVVIPLTIRKRNGRPKILPPDEVSLRDGRAQDPHVLRAVARAWSWRRKRRTCPRKFELLPASQVSRLSAVRLTVGAGGAWAVCTRARRRPGQFSPSSRGQGEDAATPSKASAPGAGLAPASARAIASAASRSRPWRASGPVGDEIGAASSLSHSTPPSRRSA